jgi:hypothetical protein
VEALRENRDHIHIYAFADGRRPPEALIARSLDDIRPALMGSPRRVPVIKKPTRRPAVSRTPAGKTALTAPAAAKD